jgi:hypothetical protein
MVVARRPDRIALRFVYAHVPLGRRTPFQPAKSLSDLDL